jgi:hypothetical protein
VPRRSRRNATIQAASRFDDKPSNMSISPPSIIVNTLTSLAIIMLARRESAKWFRPHFSRFLKLGPNFFLGRKSTASVVVHCPPLDPADALRPQEAPIHGGTDERVRGRNAISLELVVDGEIIDLNRISLPADTPIIDDRCK